MVHIIYSVTYRNIKHAKYTIVACSEPLCTLICANSSTLGDVVNLNHETDMLSIFFFLDNESLFLFGIGSIFQLKPHMADGNAHPPYDAIVTWR